MEYLELTTKGADPPFNLGKVVMIHAGLWSKPDQSKALEMKMAAILRLLLSFQKWKWLLEAPGYFISKSRGSKSDWVLFNDFRCTMNSAKLGTSTSCDGKFIGRNLPRILWWLGKISKSCWKRLMGYLLRFWAGWDEIVFNLKKYLLTQVKLWRNVEIN
jgi:hypothetical protein